MPDSRAPASRDGGESLRLGRGSYPSWRALVWFTLFRLIVALALSLVYFPSPGSVWPISGGLPGSATVLIPYTVLVLVGTLLVYVRWPSREQQVQLAVFVDILALTLLMHASGGVDTGLGLLLAIVVAAGSLMMEGRLSLLFAALATLGVIAAPLSARLYLGSESHGITHAGMLGITFFAVALVGHVLYRRIRETEEIAARREVDIADLSKLNEFIIQSMGVGVLVVDREHRIRLVNAAATQLLGLSTPPRGRRLEHIAPSLAALLSAGAVPGDRASGAVSVRERQLKPSFRLLGDNADAGVLVFLRDDRELAREAQQIKLASLGRLTASIAHNIRNPLSSVGHAGQLLAESPTLLEEDLRLLDIIRRNARRIDEVIESVLQLSRRDRAAPILIDLPSWLGEFCADYRETHALPDDRLLLQTEAETSSIKADTRHLHQILCNLCDNAFQHGSGVEQTVQVEILARAAPVGGNSLVEVIDDGPGVAPDIAGEIFNPFFTTSVSGTGLGLYIARELSETNDIDLEYIPREKRGSCFRLTFPLRHGVFGLEQGGHAGLADCPKD